MVEMLEDCQYAGLLCYFSFSVLLGFFCSNHKINEKNKAKEILSVIFNRTLLLEKKSPIKTKVNEKPIMRIMEYRNIMFTS
ncbi:hypothetical protein NCCP2331_23220 [Sporosarcina sp. NCCP-2331]|nr:hypothetical protein NCCP2331_23220 [Sporosarcina sp. NCCP-2331]GLB56223.1 hypothetical protein NCCP2378_20100 [Sporosarcina sp. NCCP-2378]